MTELKMEKGFVTGTERPVWDWTGDLHLADPTAVHMEPSFKEELGLVFLCLKRGGEELGVWLPREIVDSLRAGLAQIAAYSEETAATWEDED
jgi:hypothetical protein